MPRTSTVNTSDFGWIISLLFWLCLLVSAGLFGLMVLAPKLETYVKLDQQYYKNQYHLVQLEEQINYLTRVADALEHDPEFTTELARVDLNLTEQGSERVFVDVSLSMAAPAAQSDLPAPALRTSTLSWVLGHLQGVLKDQIWQQKLLLTLAGVVLFAFMFLQDSPKEEAPKRRLSRNKRPGPQTIKVRKRRRA